MKDSALDIFIDFLHNHLIFTVSAWENQDFMDAPENIGEDVTMAISERSIDKAIKRLNDLPRTYYKVVYCGNSFSDLGIIQNEAIAYINKLFKKNPVHFNLLVESNKLKLQKFIENFLYFKKHNETYLHHSSVSISFDQTYYDYFSYFKHEGFKELTQADYREISNDLQILKTSAETVKGIIDEYLVNANSSVSDAQANTQAPDIHSLLVDITRQNISTQAGINRVANVMERSLDKSINYQNGVFGFKLNGKIPEESYQTLILLLFPKIMDAEEKDLIDLFSGNLITTQNVVKWMPVNNKGNTLYRALIYFLQSSLFESTPDLDTFFKKVLFIFADKNGNPLKRKNLVENFRQYNANKDEIIGSTPDWKESLDEIISEIMSVSNP